MKINLDAYAEELGLWISPIKSIMPRETHSALSDALEQLNSGKDNCRPGFDWKLNKQILSKEADNYDGAGRSPHRVKIGWQFECSFRSNGQVRKNHLWTVSKMVTHIRVYTAEERDEILHFHHDLKNPGQLGPHVHMQFSEHYLKDKGRIPIAVPRFPVATVLPTDCLDLALTEFFPSEWPRTQAGCHRLAKLRINQQSRFFAISDALRKLWEASRTMTPIAATQNCFFEDLQIA